jgi:hypothetical protein
MISWRTVLDTRASGWTILVRLPVGLVVFFLRAIKSSSGTPGVSHASEYPVWELMGPFVGTIDTATGWPRYR